MILAWLVTFGKRAKVGLDQFCAFAVAGRGTADVGSGGLAHVE